MNPVDALADTGFLVSLYSLDAHSPAVAEAVRMHTSGALAFTVLHRLEFFNALRLRVFRREASEDQIDQALANWELDIAEGILSEVPMDLDEVYRRARLLSASHTRKIGVRSLDLLHLAAALELRVRIFYSFDHRQRKVAAAEKLMVRP